jgi:hypothetical protein
MYKGPPVPGSAPLAITGLAQGVDRASTALSAFVNIV